MPSCTPHHPIRLQPERRPPQWRLGESALPRPKQPLGSVLFQQPGPAERPKHLNIEGAQHLVETIAGIGPNSTILPRSNPISGEDDFDGAVEI